MAQAIQRFPSLYVGNISYYAREYDLKKELRRHITSLDHVKIIYDHKTNRNKGFGFVTVNNESDYFLLLRLPRNAVRLQGRPLFFKPAHNSIPTSRPGWKCYVKLPVPDRDFEIEPFDASLPSIHILNDYVLLKIFKLLPATKMIGLERVCRRFQSLIQHIYHGLEVVVLKSVFEIEGEMVRVSPASLRLPTLTRLKTEFAKDTVVDTIRNRHASWTFNGSSPIFGKPNYSVQQKRRITDASGALCKTLIYTGNSLTHLYLRNVHLTTSDMNAIGQLAPNLQLIYFACFASSKNARVEYVIQGCKKLKHLFLECVTLSLGLQNLKHTSLETVSIVQHGNLNFKVENLLLPSTLKNLQILEVEYPGGVETIRDMVNSCPLLEKLSLYNLPTYDSINEDLELDIEDYDYIANRCPNLSHLEIPVYEFFESTEMIKLFNKYKKLEHLHIVGTIDDMNGFIKKGLPASLKHLKISGLSSFAIQDVDFSSLPSHIESFEIHGEIVTMESYNTFQNATSISKLVIIHQLGSKKEIGIDQLKKFVTWLHLKELCVSDSSSLELFRVKELIDAREKAIELYKKRSKGSLENIPVLHLYVRFESEENATVKGKHIVVKNIASDYTTFLNGATEDVAPVTFEMPNHFDSSDEDSFYDNDFMDDIFFDDHLAYFDNDVEDYFDDMEQFGLADDFDHMLLEPLFHQ